jgi:predicted neuraminidase
MSIATKITAMLFYHRHRSSSHLRLMRLAVAFGAAIAVLAMGLAQRPVPTPLAQALVSSNSQNLATLHRVAQGNVPMPAGTAAAHASTLLPMPAKHPAALALFWFSGERESGPLVQIAMTSFDRATQQWAQPRFVVNRHTLGDKLGYGLRRLGNPVAWRDAQGRIHLFVVATGWGGWAASRILHLQQVGNSTDLNDLQFEPVRMLPLSWLWNTSYLVRNAPLPLADGGMVLPVHFELGSKIPAALRFDARGEFSGMVRMSSRNHALQPALVAQSPLQWTAYMRDERPNGKVGVVQTQDGGAHWLDLPDLALDNPDSAVAALGLGPQKFLLAHNPTSSGRASLDLSYSQDGLTWRAIQALAQGAPDDEFSYPAMAWVDGSLWVSYTVDRQRLAWQRLASLAKSEGVKQ